MCRRRFVASQGGITSAGCCISYEGLVRKLVFLVILDQQQLKSEQKINLFPSHSQPIRRAVLVRLPRLAMKRLQQNFLSERTTQSEIIQQLELVVFTMKYIL